MAALRALITGELPPVGQRVKAAGAVEPPPAFPGYSPLWTSSGTAALVLALRLACERRPEVRQPKVLLPAYGCPDLVTAAVVAGVRPVLVDIRELSPSFDLEALDGAWDDDVVAVVAVNFLGVAERLGDLRSLAAVRRVLLIEDCAQWFPEAALEGDAVILSFGRGKPVNLLGGGGLLVKDGIGGALPELAPAASGGSLRLRAALFNCLLRPRAYAWVTRAPLLQVGSTRYRPSVSVAVMDPAHLGHLARNARAWLARSRWREAAYDRVLASIADVVLVAAAPARVGRLLRYPFLAGSRHARDRALQALAKRGLGASALYGAPLTRVAGVPREIAAQGGFPGAERFAGRLLTLPLHDGVTDRHIEKIAAVLDATLAAQAPRSASLGSGTSAA